MNRTENITMTNGEFAHLGEGSVAYLRKVSSDELLGRFPNLGEIAPGMELWALFAANGQPILLSDAFARQLGPDREGLIVNMVDQRVWRPNPLFFSYSLSKAGLWWATQTMAQGLAPRIRVNAIGPGPTLASIHQTADEFEAEARATLLQHAASPDEIAAALTYLIDARSVTGQMIAIDAGQHFAIDPAALSVLGTAKHQPEIRTIERANALPGRLSDRYA